MKIRDLFMKIRDLFKRKRRDHGQKKGGNSVYNEYQPYHLPHEKYYTPPKERPSGQIIKQ